jgi:hypothetical protein
MRRMLIVAVASALATGAVIAAAGIAQSGGDDEDGPPPTMAQALKQRQQQRDARLGRVARRLDISTDKLKDAIEKVRTEELDELVRQGRLTDAQRDALLACKNDPLTCDRSNLPAPRFFKHRQGQRPDRGQMLRRFRQHRQEFFADLGRELGIDADRVREAFQAERPRGPRGGPMGGPPGPPPGGGPRPGAFGPPPGEVEPAAAPA